MSIRSGHELFLHQNKNHISIRYLVKCKFYSNIMMVEILSRSSLHYVLCEKLWSFCLFFSYKFTRTSRLHVDTKYTDWGQVIQYIAKDEYSLGGYLVAIAYGLYATQDLKNFNLVAGHSNWYSYKEGNGGSARFGNISGIVLSPQDRKSIWVADNTNKCVRKIDRFTRNTRPLTGKCLVNSVQDGKFLKAKIGNIVELVKMNNEAIYFFDNTGRKIRCLCKKRTGWEVITVFTANRQANSIALDRSKNYIYMTHPGRISRVSTTWRYTTYHLLIDDNPHYYGDGEFSKVALGNPQQMLFLEDHLFLVADLRFNNLRLIDVYNENVSSICIPQESNIGIPHGDFINYCKLVMPIRLLFSQSRSAIHIAASNAIYDLLYSKCIIYQYSSNNIFAPYYIFGVI